MLPITVITDCTDDNARMRIETRLAALMPGEVSITFCGVRNELEAAGNVVDALDSFAGRPGRVLVNVAPRKRHKRPMHWNGSPFGCVRVGKASVFGTVEGETFSLLAKVLGPKTVDVFDIEKVVAFLGVPESTQKWIIETQFRSFEFLPRLVAALESGRGGIPSEQNKIVADVKPKVWWVDNFGNLKTTILPEEIGFAPGKQFWIESRTPGERVMCYSQLRDIPSEYALGLTIGSSGLGDKRWLEIACMDLNAADRVNIRSGDEVKLRPMVE